MTGSDIVFNTRCLGGPSTGVQRYAQVLYEGLGVEGISPTFGGSGMSGHLWEQTALVARMRGRILFSPGNTGPLFYENQVLVVHDASTLDHPEWFNSKFAKWYCFLLPRLIRRVRKVITVSEFSRRRILHHVPEAAGKVEVVYNGIDLAHFDAAQGEEHEAGAEQFVLCVSSLDPRKNLERLLQAWRLAETAGHELWIAGGGLGRVFGKFSLSDAVPGVRFLGRVSDGELGSLYRRARGFVFPSLYEGFGLPPLEAMASGCPVAMANATSLPEVGGPECSDSALPAVQYFDPFNVDEMAHCISRFASASSECRAAAESVVRERATRFSWKSNIRATQKILGDLK